MLRLNVSNDLPRLEIKNFRGLSTRKAAHAIDMNQTPAVNGMFITPKNALTPLPLITNQTSGLNKITSLIPVQFSNNTKYLIVTDGTDFKATSGDGVYSYIGYTTGTVTRSTTALTGTSTVWATNIQAGDQFKYNVDSTWLNISVVNSDTSITLSSGSGATSGAYTIRKVMNNTVRPKGAVLNDLLILCDGIRIADKWDGTSLQRISGMPFVRGLELHKRHIFGFTKDTLYWCDINTPTIWTTTNLETVAVKDSGDIVAIKSYAESLFIFKSNGRIYSLVGEAPFVATTLTYTITQITTPSYFGNVASETINTHNNLLRFQTTVGTWDFDGVSFQLITRDLQPTVDAVSVPDTLSSSTLIDDTAAEFNAGTYSDTEYDTTNSRLQLDATKLRDDFTDGDFTSNPVWTVQVGSGFSVNSNKLRKTSSSLTVGTITTPSTNAYGEWVLDIAQVSGTHHEARFYFISSSTDYTTTNGYMVSLFGSSAFTTLSLFRLTAGAVVSLATTTVSLTTGTVRITRGSGGDLVVYVDGVQKLTASDTTYTTSSVFLWYDAKWGGSGSHVIDFDNFYTSALSGTFTSQVFDGTTSLVRWDVLNVDTTLNGEAVTLEYRAEASSPPSGAWTSISNGAIIGATARYLQYRATFASSTKVGITPYITSVNIGYSISKDSNNKPVAISFKDRWHLAYCPSGLSNTDTLIQDEASEWLSWKGSAVCFSIFANTLYTGQTDGTVQLWYVGNTVIGDSRFWTSPIIDFSLPEYVKRINRIILTYKFTSATLTVRYILDGGTPVDTDVSLASTGSTDVPIRTLLIDKSCNNIQLRLSFTTARETEDFEIYSTIIYWQRLELR